MRRLLLTAGVAAMAYLTAGAAWLRGDWRPFEPALPVWGVDVSHHQGGIDWDRLRREEPRIAFAYLKATEGGDWADPTFADHWRRARAAGLRVGAYHFFTFCRSPEEQLANFRRVLPRDPDTLPPAVDVEFGGNCEQPPPRAEVAANLRTFLTGLEQTTGRRPILYVTREAYDAVLGDQGLPHPLWLRSIYRAPPPAMRWTLWQFDPRGRLPGVEGFIDLNAFQGTRDQLGQL